MSPSPPDRRPPDRAVVVGGGVSGLTAALRLSQAGSSVTVVEPGPLGGKLQTSVFAGRAVDETADAFLLRVPWALALCHDLELDGELVSPVARQAEVFVDDARHPQLRGTRWSLGALYDLYEPSPAKEARPPGVYNESMIVMQFPHIEHWLNGTRILTATIGSEAWFGRYAASKFVEHPGFGGFGRGRIMLTDHGGETWYRSVRLTPLPAQRSAAFALKLGGVP